MTTPTSSEQRALILTSILVVVIVLISGSMGVYVMSDPDILQAVRLTRTALEIDRQYSGQLDWDRIFDRAMKAMFDRLDRYSGYIDARSLDRIDEELSGSYSGIGVSIIQHDRGLLIMSVRESGPGARVGLLTGDIIVKIDSLELADLTIDQSSTHLRGEEGTEVEVVIIRPSTDDSLAVTITRSEIELQHIPYAGLTANHMIYVRLLDFDPGAAEDLSKAIDSLLDLDHSPPRGLILDLRSNPGGLLNEALAVTDLFLGEGKLIVGTEGRSFWSNEEFYATEGDVTDGLPMVVLVDGGSASASEIVAGALWSAKRAQLVGDTTFGKGLVQGYTRFGDGTAVRLTISRYYFEGRRFLNEFDSTLTDTGIGLAPDVVVSFPEHQEFALVLENSLLLHSFANAHQDEIIATGAELALDDSWVNRFATFAAEQNFEYVSSIREHANFVLAIAALETHQPSSLRAASELVKLARSDDLDQFNQFQDYIRTRLKEIAWERKFGRVAAYENVIVRERQDIQVASRLLSDSRREQHR